MIGAVHIGLLAACVVLFVPMAMAGWHLSRNKMLFFSCALFITLAVGVHLMPYFPSISDFLSPSEVISLSSPSNRDSCVSFLHSVVYSGGGVVKECGIGCEKRLGWDWDWVGSGRVAGCEFQKLMRSDASDLLNGSWVVVAGDSQARLMAVSLLELVMGNEAMERVRGDLFKRHSDYSITVDEIGMKLDFFWAPYVGNLTELVLQLRRSRNIPDVMVVGAGLWDMLHVNNASEYGSALRVLRDNSLTLLPVSSNLDGGNSNKPAARFLHLFWVGMPMLITTMLNTDEKREKMTTAIYDSYEDELTTSKIWRESGGPFFKLDVRLLSELCGPRCTSDGMHYDGVVYDATVQIMLNALLIESNQKLE